MQVSGESIKKSEAKPMTEGELALARHVLEQVREEKEVILSNREKVDLDSVTDYFNNLLSDVEKNKKRGKIKDGVINYRLIIEVKG